MKKNLHILILMIATCWMTVSAATKALRFRGWKFRV